MWWEKSKGVPTAKVVAYSCTPLLFSVAVRAEEDALGHLFLNRGNSMPKHG